MIPELRINDDVTAGQLKKLVETTNSYFEYEADRDCHEMVIKQSFDSFMADVEVECIKQTGLNTSDFEDWDWKGEYDGNAEPSEAVSEMLAEVSNSYCY